MHTRISFANQQFPLHFYISTLTQQINKKSVAILWWHYISNRNYTYMTFILHFFTVFWNQCLHRTRFKWPRIAQYMSLPHFQQTYFDLGSVNIRTLEIEKRVGHLALPFKIWPLHHFTGLIPYPLIILDEWKMLFFLF